MPGSLTVISSKFEVLVSKTNLWAPETECCLLCMHAVHTFHFTLVEMPAVFIYTQLFLPGEMHSDTAAPHSRRKTAEKQLFYLTEVMWCV